MPGTCWETARTSVQERPVGRTHWPLAPTTWRHPPSIRCARALNTPLPSPSVSCIGASLLLSSVNATTPGLNCDLLCDPHENDTNQRPVIKGGDVSLRFGLHLEACGHRGWDHRADHVFQLLFRCSIHAAQDERVCRTSQHWVGLWRTW